MSDSQLNTVQNAQALCNLNAETQTQLTSDIKTGVENNIAQPNKTVQDFLALGAATFNISEATFSTNITNEFVNAIRHTTTNICESIFQSTDNYVMTICGDLENTTINLNQNATVTALTSCINKVLQGTSLNRVLTQTDQSTEQRGLGSSLMWIPIIG